MKVIANNAATQAVLATPSAGEDVLMIVAWPASATTVVDSGKAGLKVTVLGPTKGGLVTVKLGESGAVFSAADPTNNSEGGTLTYTIDKSIEELRATAVRPASETTPFACKKGSTSGSTTVTITLPSGVGATVTGSARHRPAQSNRSPALSLAVYTDLQLYTIGAIYLYSSK